MPIYMRNGWRRPRSDVYAKLSLQGVLAPYGVNAHSYWFGDGALSGITAGNYLESAGTTAATVDNPVGLVVDSFGAVNATQATTANKPILRRGLLSLLTYSNDLANAAWNSLFNVTATSTSFTESATTSIHVLQRSTILTITSGTAYTCVAKVKENGRNYISFMADSANANLGGICRWNLETGANTLTGAGCTVSSASVGDGWYLLAISATATGPWARPGIGLATDGTTTPLNFQSYLGDGVSGVLVDGIGVFQGTYTAQQIIDAGGIPLTTSAAASSATGKYWWQFDGTDSLSLSSPLFQMSDDHCVIAGFNASAVGVYVFSHTNTSTGVHCATVRVASDGKPSAWWRDDSTAQDVLYGPSSIVGSASVVTAKKAAALKSLRVNGSLASSAGTSLGTTTLNEYAIGKSGAGYMQGSIYPIIAIKGMVTDSDLLTLERFVGQLSGVSI